MPDKMRPSYPRLYDAIKAKLWDARRAVADREEADPALAILVGTATVAELFLNWHMPPAHAGIRPHCDTCTGENIVYWPCEYTLRIARAVGIEVDRG